MGSNQLDELQNKGRIEAAIQRIKTAVSLRKRSDDGTVHLSELWGDCELCGGLVYATDTAHGQAHQTLAELGVKSPLHLS